jgi:hypothetical protein
MKTKTEFQSIRRWIAVFIVLLILSGVTAFPIQTEINFMMQYKNSFPEFMRVWLEKISYGVNDVHSKYPFIAYGTDWLAFAHLVIAVAFIGPYRDPVKNIWVIEFGMIACAMVIPLALIAGAVRDIPFWWRLIDCSFGVFGIMPLWIVRSKILNMKKEVVIW